MPFDAEITTKSRDLIVLEKARAINAARWCTRMIEDPEGNHCMAGAINVAHHGTPHYDYANIGYFHRAMKALGFRGTEIDTLCSWNNSHTQAEVLARYDVAILKLSA